MLISKQEELQKGRALFSYSKWKKRKNDGGIPISDKERPSVSSKLKASLTVEAALSVPIFLFFLMAVLSFFLLLSLQTEIQASMEETGRSFGKKAYLAERLGGEDEVGVLSAGINSLSVKTDMMGRGLKHALDASRVRDGADGFYVYHTAYDREQGILDIVVNYTYVFPFLPEQFGSVRLVQRSRSHVWTGRRLRDSEGANKEESQKIVYITPSGSAYHLSTACPYLDLSIHAVSAAAVSALRNQDGKIYYDCPDCARKGAACTVYITDYGTRWHSSLSCSGLKRTIEAVELSQVGSQHLCSRCAELFGSGGS